MARALVDVLEALLSGVVVVNASGEVEEINTTACRMLGRSREAALGRTLAELAGPTRTLHRLAEKALLDGAPVSEPGQSLHAPGAEACLVDVTASPLFSDGVAEGGALLVLRDRAAGGSRLEELEAERRRFVGLGRIAAGLAHEIKNPLGGIRGAGELLVKRAPDEKTRTVAGLVVDESARIAKLVDDFMVFAREEKLNPAPVNVHRLLDAVLELLSHDPLCREVRIERAYDPSLPEFLADGDRLVQVALNLARNALQAMAGGPGTLRVETRLVLTPRIALEQGRPLPTLSIVFEDSGHGMNSDVLREARLPFFTTRSQGTGLGLAVADYWVAQHQGLLRLESREGTGTRAQITLPLRRAEK